MMKPKHLLAYGDVCDVCVLRVVEIFTQVFFFTTLLFYLNPASPLELIRDLAKTLLQCAHTHMQTLYTVNIHHV